MSLNEILRIKILKAVKENDNALADASPEYQKDKEIILAVKRNSNALRFTDPEYQKTKKSF